MGSVNAAAHSESIASTIRHHCATIRSPRVVTSGNASVPHTLLGIVDAVLPEYRVNILNAPAGIPAREGVVHETSFVGAGMRKSPTLAYVPARLSLVPTLWSRSLHPDIVLVHTSAPIDGKVSLGMEVNVLPAAIEAVRRRGGLVLAQVNEKMPYTFGDGEYELKDFDGWIEADDEIAHPNPPAPAGERAETAAIIGDYCASRVRSGATLQLGIGEIPDATLPGLTKLRDLGLWTEMFSDRLLALRDAGALDPHRYLTASFAVGSTELLEFAHRNEQMRMLRTETVNAPANVAKQPGMTSINTAMQIDLFAQANASRRKARIHSGFGGQTDFIVGALHAPGGQAIMALRSWHPKANVSTVVPLIEEPVTSFQPSAIITEQGVAEVGGRPEKEQARAIIDNCAHPSVRDELWEEAAYLSLA
ncbi:MAG: acetyl-CoA hydrolase/transferase C-terminal domain-containing protein [Actinomycetia bacterium]|nr:acetyl-CoA hydrolase/transferase C-terminal domain-containing protein [Actinomycetes bacterium]